MITFKARLFVVFGLFLCLFSGITFSDDPAAPVYTVTINIDEHPNQRFDGSPFSFDEIQKYQIFYSREGQDEKSLDMVPDETANIKSLDSGFYTFQAVLHDTSGLVSIRSEPITLDLKSHPKPPTLKIKLVCESGCSADLIFE